MQQYAINLKDFRVVLCTRETLNNIDYHLISQKTMEAIRDGRMSAKEVAERIKGEIMSSGEMWDRMLERKTSQNVAKTQLTREDVERSQTVMDDVDGRDVFDIGGDAGADAVGNDEPEDVEKPKTKPKGKPKGEPQPELSLDDAK